MKCPLKWLFYFLKYPHENLMLKNKLKDVINILFYYILLLNITFFGEKWFTLNVLSPTKTKLEVVHLHLK